MRNYLTLAIAFLFIHQSSFSCEENLSTNESEHGFIESQLPSYFENAAFMFRIKKDEKTIYFQGTHHFLSYETLCHASQDIIEKATVRYLEYTSDQKPTEEEFLSLLDCLIKPEEHEKIKAYLTEDVYNNLKNAADEHFKELEEEGKVEFLNILKEKNFQFNQLGAIGLAFTSMMYGQKKGMDNHMSKKYSHLKALDEKLNIKGIVLFLYGDDMNQDAAKQESIILELAKRITSDINNNSDFNEPYKNGNLKKLKHLVLCEDFQDEWFKTRNNIWFQKLKSEVLNSEEYVVACGGVGHIELLSLFEKDGFSLEIMDRNGVFYPFQYASLEN
ncbi:MAG: hypothetical protein FADNKDHG_01544 [Holosporales bacterium]